MKSKLKIFYCCTLFACLVGSIAFFVHIPTFRSTPHPVASYDEALKKFTAIEQEESQLPLCKEGASLLLVHGTKTDRVFVLLHGLSSCPEQFALLGKILFDSGANVIIPRAKYAGFSNLLNNEQCEQSGEDLLEQAATGLDIATGLGKNITLIGISAGALSAAWMAEHREDIDQVLLIAPFFGAYGWNVPLMNATAVLLAYSPNFYIWKKKSLHPLPYVYPRYGTRCLGKTLALAHNVRSFDGIMKARRIDILLSASDDQVNNQLTKGVIAKWSVTNPGKITETEFPAAMNIPHDCLDPHGKNNQIEKNYPIILEILGVGITRLCPKVDYF